MRVFDNLLRADVRAPSHELGKPLGRAQLRDDVPRVALGAGAEGPQFFQLLLGDNPGLVHVLALREESDFGFGNMRTVKNLENEEEL